MKQVHFQDDFKFRLDEPTVDAAAVEVRSSGGGVYCCCRCSGTLRVTDDGLLCIVDAHQLAPGALTCKIVYQHPDDIYPDGHKMGVKTVDPGITLTTECDKDLPDVTINLL